MSHAQKKASLRLRVRSLTLDGCIVKKIEIIGDFPDNALRENIEFVVSVFDCADGGIHPVLSTESEFHEQFTMVYESRVRVGEILPYMKKIDGWMPVAIFPSEFVLGPYAGKRKLMAVVRLVNIDANVYIEAGSVLRNKNGVIWVGKVNFYCRLYGDGYIRISKRCRRIESIAIRLAAAVAIADGTLDSEEIKVLRRQINRWIEDSENRYDGLDERRRSNSYKGMMKRALIKARANEINTASLLKSMRISAGRALWIDTLELCYDVIFANGVAHASQLRLLREIADSSRLDTKELEKLRDHKAINFEIKPTVEVATEELLGIDASWDQARIRRHLRMEYKKWNGRLNTIPEGKARENAQGILNMIGEAYKKYSFSKPTPQATSKDDQALQAAPKNDQTPQATSKDDQALQAASKNDQTPQATSKDDQALQAASKNDQTPQADRSGAQLDLFESLE